MKVTLDPDDLEDAYNIAWLRNEVKNIHGIESKRYTQKYADLDTHIVGVVAERIVARFLGVEFDRRVMTTGDAGYDLKLGPLTVQVKYRAQPGWSFACEGFLEADIGVLVYPSEDNDTFVIAGWTTRTHFATRFKIADYGYGVRHVIECDEMFDPSKLLEFAQEVKDRWFSGQQECSRSYYERG